MLVSPAPSGVPGFVRRVVSVRNVHFFTSWGQGNLLLNVYGILHRLSLSLDLTLQDIVMPRPIK